MYAIEKGIEMPARKPGPGASPKYPFAVMSVGDSFLFKGKQSLVACAARVWGMKHKKKFATRTVDGGVRVWRVE